MIKNKQPNPLNFFNIRRIEFPPEYFEYVDVPMRYNIEDSIVKWIETNLKGRFYLGKSVKTDSTNALVSYILVGFEDPKESSYFTLACPYLKYT